MQHFDSVFLKRMKRYSEKDIHHFLEHSFKHCLGDNLSGKKVLLKPNLISARGDGLACTDPRMILSTCTWLKDNGASVVIGDSPAFGTAAKALHSLGIDSELKRYHVPVVEFKTVIIKELKCGQEIGIAREALECDLFLNIPKVKAHNQMYVTLSVKNIFGIVKGMRKSMAHMVHGKSREQFSRIILDLLHLLPPHIHLLDGITAMHIEGPMNGKPFDLGIIGCSRNGIAMDTSVLHLLGADPAKSPLWREAKSIGLIGTDLDQIQYPHATPSDLRVKGFMTPGELSPIRFNPFRFIYGNAKRIGLKLIGN